MGVAWQQSLKDDPKLVLHAKDGSHPAPAGSYLAACVFYATLLDKGDFARKEISMAKVHVADTLQLCVDTALQLCGARGYSKDTPLEWIYRYARQARLVDGATEVHQQVLARHFMEERGEFWRWA